jgi:hypothetical protein
VIFTPDSATLMAVDESLQLFASVRDLVLTFVSKAEDGWYIERGKNSDCAI